MNLGGSHADVIMDDCRKSQTLDSLPGKAGGLPILIIVRASGCVELPFTSLEMRQLSRDENDGTKCLI